MDSALISGMARAISSFLDELDRDHMFGFETMERTNITITSHKLEHSSLVVISTRTLPFIILDQIKNAHFKLEDEFEAELIENESGLDELSNQIVDSILVSSGFKVDILDNLKIKHSKLNQIRRTSAISRMIRKQIPLITKFEIGLETQDKSFGIHELIRYFRGQNLHYDLIYKIIMILHGHRAFTKAEN